MLFYYHGNDWDGDSLLIILMNCPKMIYLSSNIKKDPQVIPFVKMFPLIFFQII